MLLKMLKENKKFIYVFVAELILLLASIILLIMPKDVYNVPVENSESYIMDLPFGRYIVDVDYELKDNYVTIVPSQTGEKQWYNGKIFTQGMALSDQFNNEAYEMWVTGVSTKACVYIYYANEQPVDIYSIEIRETNYAYWCLFLIVLAVIGITGIIFLIKSRIIKLSKKDCLVILSLMGIIIISSLPVFTEYLTVGFDTFFHMVRIEGVKDGLLAGQFPVRVEPTYEFGHGYAVSLFYGGLFFYIPAVLRLIGFNLQFSYKIFILVISTMMALSSYFLFKEMGKKRFLGVIGSALYTLSMYKFCTSYYRGAVAETIAMAILPIIVLGLWNIYTKPMDEKYSKRWLLPALGYTAVIQSHIISTEIFGVITVIVCLLLWKKTFKKQTFVVLLKVVIFTLVINLWFIVPWFDCMNELQMPCNQWGNVNGNIQDSGIKLSEIFKFQLGEYTYEKWYLQTYFFGFGITTGLAALVSVITFIYNAVKKKFNAAHMFLLILSVAVTFLNTNLFPWDAIIAFFMKRESTLFIANMIANIQYPYRIASVAIVLIISSMIIGISNIKINERIKILTGSFIAAIAAVQFILLAASNIATQYNSKEELCFVDELSNNYSPIIGNGEYIPLNQFLNWGIEDTFKIHNYYGNNVVVTNFNKKYTNASLDVTNPTDEIGIVEVALLYYPGYTAIDTKTGGEVPIVHCVSNRIGVFIHPGDSLSLRFEYTGKDIWRMVDKFSLFAFVGIILYYLGIIDFIKKIINSRNIKN